MPSVSYSALSAARVGGEKEHRALNHGGSFHFRALDCEDFQSAQEVQYMCCVVCDVINCILVCRYVWCGGVMRCDVWRCVVAHKVLGSACQYRR
jgi:hypothetical protein